MSKPVYTVQVDSRFRDLEKYPNSTDFGVSFKKRTSTSPFVEGIPVNNEASNSSLTNFKIPVSIDPDFDNDLFQILNGKITNLKAIDENNIILSGIFTGNKLSFYQNDMSTDIQFSESDLIISIDNNNFSVFLIKFSRFENIWSFNWAVFVKQTDEFIALNDPTISCSFDINQNNICFLTNFSCPKIYLQSLTSLSVQNNKENITLYEIYNPDNITKTDTYPYKLNNCLFYTIFDNDGNIKYTDNHPWGYNIISSNHNIIPSEDNGKINIKFDNSNSQVISANTNNYNTVLSLTGFSTGLNSNIFPINDAYGITYSYSGINYVINLIQDSTTNETNIITQEYNEGTLYDIKMQCLTGITSSGIFGNNFPNVSYIQKNDKIYFHFSPFNASLSNIFYTPYTYQSYIYTYDINTKDTVYTTTGAGNFAGSRLGFPGSKMFDSTTIDSLNLTGAYIIGPNTSVYETTGSKVEIYYWDETVNPPYLINSYDFSPSRRTILTLIPFTYGIGYYSSIIEDNNDIYYVCSPAPLSTGTMTGDGLQQYNITSLYKINNTSITGSQIYKTFDTYSYFYPKLYVQNTELNLISASPNSEIYNINKSTLELIKKSKFNGGGFSVFVKEYNNNLYAIYNNYFYNNVYNITNPEQPILISGKQQFPVFSEFEIGQLLFIDNNGWCYGYLINQNLNTSYFFSCIFLTKPAEIKSSHYNQNISEKLTPINYYGQPVSTYSIDYLYKPSESLITNSLGFNPVTQLLDTDNNSILYAWYDASNTNSILISNTGIDNYIVQVNDLSNNNITLYPYTGMISPQPLVYKYANSIHFKGGMELRSLANNTGIAYMAIAYRNNTGSSVEYNIVGKYNNTDSLNNIYTYYNGTDTYAKYKAGVIGINSVSVGNPYTNQPIKNLADFKYMNLNSNGVWDFSFRGMPSTSINSEQILNFTGSYIKLGDSYQDINNSFNGEIYEVIITKDIPTDIQRQKIISYLGKKWNMNNYVPENNPYKQYSDSKIYSTLLTKASTGYSNVDIYDISNLKNITKIDSIETNISNPTYIKNFSSTKIAGQQKESNWIFVLGNSSLEIYTDLYSETYNFFLVNNILFTNELENNCWKIVVYKKNISFNDIELYFIIIFKNGYAKKYKIVFSNNIINVEDLVTTSFELPVNGYLTSGEVNTYPDGKIYFFGMVGITDVYLFELSQLVSKGKVYFCDITNQYDFITIESNYNFALETALTNRNSTKIINHPNGNIYLYLRSIFIDGAQFINITDYNLFNYNNKLEIVSTNQFSFQTPINISNILSYEDGIFGCFCPADIYINPSNNNLISIQTQNNNLTNDYITPQNQQFYLGFTNCNYITNDPEGTIPIYPFGTRVTQLKAGIYGNKVYAGMLLTDISNSFAATGVYFMDISNPEFSYTYYQNELGDYPEPSTSIYNNREGISIGFINKCNYEGKSEWLNSIGGEYTDLFSQFNNISNISLDDEKRYIYILGGWNSKIECFDKNNNITNKITSSGSSYNGFCAKIDILDGNFKWITPMIGNNEDYTEKISFNKIKNNVSFIINFNSNNLFVYEPQYSNITGTFTNPLVVKTVLFNTSSLSSSIITLDTEGIYTWKVILYSNEEQKFVNTKDIYIDDETINIVGTNNTSIMKCTQSDNTNTQLLYNTETNSSLYIYRFDLDGIYIQSNNIIYPNNVDIYVNDIKSYKNINQIIIFPYNEILDLNIIPYSYVKKYNKDGTVAKYNIISNQIFINSNSFLYSNTGQNWEIDLNSDNIINQNLSTKEISIFETFNNGIYIFRKNQSISLSQNIGIGYLYYYDNILNNIVHDVGTSDFVYIPIEINVMKKIDNNLYIGGNMKYVNFSEQVNNIYYINTGNFVNLLSNGLNGMVYSIEKYQGNIYAGGDFTGDYDNLITSNNISYFDGSNWNSVQGLNGIVRTLETDGTYLYAGGDFTGSNSTILNHIAYWDGSNWNSMQSGLNDTVNTLYYKDGNLYAGGKFTKTSNGETGSTLLNYIARWDGNWNSMNQGLSNTVNVITDYTGSYISVAGDFSNSFLGTPLNYVSIWNTGGWEALSTGLNQPIKHMNYTGTNTLYISQTLPIVENNKYTQVNFYKYISSYKDLNNKNYSYLSLTYSEFENYYQSQISPSGTNTLTNYNAFIQGASFGQEITKIINTKQTLIAPNNILNKNFSIRGNLFTGASNFFSTENTTNFNIILNNEIDIKNIDRTNLSFFNYKWTALITKSKVGDLITYEKTGPSQYIQNNTLPITITNIYGQALSTYSNINQTSTPYYLYYNEGGIINYTLVNSVIYNNIQKIYYLTINTNYSNLPFNEIWISKKNLSAEYTLQFYPSTLNTSKTYNISLNNLIIPNRPIRNTSLEGTRLLTDLPYIYLSVYNSDENGLWYGQTGPMYPEQGYQTSQYGKQEINNFFSNNVTKEYNAIFEIPMKYAQEQENFIVLSAYNKPRVKFTPNFYNIRYRLTDPDGNILLFDNTPYKSIDNFEIVPDSLMQTNISINFETLTN